MEPEWMRPSDAILALSRLISSGWRRRYRIEYPVAAIRNNVEPRRSRAHGGRARSVCLRARDARRRRRVAQHYQHTKPPSIEARQLRRARPLRRTAAGRHDYCRPSLASTRSNRRHLAIAVVTMNGDDESARGLSMPWMRMSRRAASSIHYTA